MEKLYEPYIPVPEELWTVEYNEIIKNGKNTNKSSKTCGNPIFIYNDLMYVVDHNKKSVRITQRFMDVTMIQRGR